MESSLVPSSDDDVRIEAEDCTNRGIASLVLRRKLLLRRLPPRRIGDDESAAIPFGIAVEEEVVEVPAKHKAVALLIRRFLRNINQKTKLPARNTKISATSPTRQISDEQYTPPPTELVVITPAAAAAAVIGASTFCMGDATSSFLGWPGGRPRRRKLGA